MNSMTGNEIVARAWAHFEEFVAKHVDELEGLTQAEIIERYSDYCASIPSQRAMVKRMRRKGLLSKHNPNWATMTQKGKRVR
jgi:hypothetical protein